MLRPENQTDKQRFEHKKTAKTSRGAPEKKAIQNAAAEVKQERREEGRSKS